MKIANNAFLAAGLYCLSLPAMAGGSVSKEPAYCVGARQTYNFTWVYLPDAYQVYTAQAKKSSESDYQWQYSSANSSHCQWVGFGTPYGSTTHNWRASGSKPGPPTVTDYTRPINFYQSDPCQGGGIND